MMIVIETIMMMTRYFLKDDSNMEKIQRYDGLSEMVLRTCASIYKEYNRTGLFSPV